MIVRDHTSLLPRRLRAITALALAFIFALPATAGAGSASVTISAQIAHTFSLTILTDGLVSFGEVTTGAVYTSPSEQVLRVSSSLPWNFSDSSDATIDLSGVVVPRDQVVRHTPNPGFGSGLAAGTRVISCVYTLDLTSAEALTLQPGDSVSTRLGYTVVQQ